jgi:hypothetical protein
MAEASEAPVLAPTTPGRERNVLVLDLSKSMLAPLPEPSAEGPERQKIEVARTAVFRILENAASAGSSFGLVTFTETVRVPLPLTEINRQNLSYIENLISLLAPSGRSAIWDALAVAADMLRQGSAGVQGNIVLVTDGWDNASTKFDVRDQKQATTQAGKIDLFPYMLPPNSNLTLRIIGIGSGDERDKGVDATRMGQLLTQLNARAAELGLPGAFSYQEVTTGSQLFAQMVNAFLDVDFEGQRPLDQLPPEELARHAANAAKALKEPQQHATVSRLGGHMATVARQEDLYSEAQVLEVDVLSPPGGAIPPNLKERYGPLGEVIEAYLSHEYDRALDQLNKSQAVLPPVTRLYWEARTRFAQGAVVEAARALLQAWGEADKLPLMSQGRIIRRLALLQARMQSDQETETLVKFIDETENRLTQVDPTLRARLLELFAKLMELRGTYQLTKLGATDEAADAAQRHEAAVEDIFGLLQDTRMSNTSTEPMVEGALDFIEICLAEMR